MCSLCEHTGLFPKALTKSNFWRVVYISYISAISHSFLYYQYPYFNNPICVYHYWWARIKSRMSLISHKLWVCKSICKDTAVNMTWGVSFGCCCFTVPALNWIGTSCKCSGLDLTPRWGYVRFTELPNANTQEMSLKTKDVHEREKDTESKPQEVRGRVCWLLPRDFVKAHSRFSRTERMCAWYRKNLLWQKIL